MKMIDFSVIIPTLNAEYCIESLLKGLASQTMQPKAVYVIDSESSDRTVEIAKTYPGVVCESVERAMFDHGGTRDASLRRTDSEYTVFMTQDTCPVDENLFERLLTPLIDHSDIAVSYARQIAKKDATQTEKLIRSFNYPGESRITSACDFKTLGIKTFFSSDVCAAYRNKTYYALGGFVHPIKCNEDMQFAATAIQNGFRVAYTADAKVFHSHNFTLKQEYRRHYNVGYELEKHKDMFAGAKDTAEGVAMVCAVIRGLLKCGKPLAIPYFILNCGVRFLGNRSGRHDFRKSLKHNAITEKSLAVYRKL